MEANHQVPQQRTQHKGMMYLVNQLSALVNAINVSCKIFGVAKQLSTLGKMMQ
jgi:hypothetical protein